MRRVRRVCGQGAHADRRLRRRGAREDDDQRGEQREHPCPHPLGDASSAYTLRRSRPDEERARRDEHRQTVERRQGRPPAIGPYCHAVRTGDLLFCSGQIPLDPRDGRDRRVDTPAEQTRQCLRNLDAIARAGGAILADAVRIGVFLVDMGAFAEVNEAYAEFFAEDDAPARYAFGVASLPAGRARRASRRSSRFRGAVPRSVTAEDVAAAREAVRDVARHTPVLPSETLSERAGGARAGQGGDAAADRLVQDPRRAEQARRTRATRRRASSRAARATTRRRSRSRPVSAACRARSTCRARRRSPRSRAPRRSAR